MTALRAQRRGRILLEGRCRRRHCRCVVSEEAPMTLTRLERSLWCRFFDDASRALQGRPAEIEVSSIDLGRQVVAEWRPLLGIVYDQHNDLVEIALEGFDHLVHRPTELYIDGPLIGWASLSVIDGDGALQVLTLREPLMLPPALE
jgi:hypothetical protein